jgi:hypothetical protein
MQNKKATDELFTSPSLSEAGVSTATFLNGAAIFSFAFSQILLTMSDNSSQIFLNALQRRLTLQ